MEAGKCVGVMEEVRKLTRYEICGGTLLYGAAVTVTLLVTAKMVFGKERVITATIPKRLITRGRVHTTPRRGFHRAKTHASAWPPGRLPGTCPLPIVPAQGTLSPLGARKVPPSTQPAEPSISHLIRRS
jgi:hypothetical protein